MAKREREAEEEEEMELFERNRGMREVDKTCERRERGRERELMSPRFE